MGPSKIDKYIKEEHCAKQRALLGVFSSRYSSVSRGYQKNHFLARYDFSARYFVAQAEN
jgi:hypothetical protein